LIPAGEFTMGCAPSVDDECASFNDENPGHEVWLDAYAIHETEVTVAAYSKCVNSGECSPPGTGSGCNWNKAGKEGHPVNCVTWDQADAYCRWADKELPTEAQWEKAARGEKPRKYPWGGTSPSCEAELAIMLEVEFGGCGTSVTWKVGSMPDGASPYDVLDMAGNVREWVADVYDNNYYGESPARNPRGPGGGSVVRVLRGGGLDSDAKGLRTSEREYNDGSSPSYDVGFRCALWVDW
jgi:iron(II)-dependent oxidoreductase